MENDPKVEAVRKGVTAIAEHEAHRREGVGYLATCAYCAELAARFPDWHPSKAADKKTPE